KIPRQHSMYSFNLKNIDPSGDLACLFAKSLIDESNKWHRRLGHVKFKNLNKLVKGNLVRGLPSKIFNNDHTCVACQKGKQHKASCKITPLFPLLLTQAAVAEGEDSGTHTESQPTPSPTQPKGIGGSGWDQVYLPYDSPLSGGYTSDRDEGSLNMEALYALCTNLSNRVLALETSISHHQAWLRSVSLLSKNTKLSKRKSVSEQGRKTAKSGPTKDGSDKLDAELDEDMEPDVSTARQKLSIDGPTTTPTTSTIFDDEEINLENTLIKLKDDKAKGRFTHSQLKKKSFEEIRGLYIKKQELVADFVPIGSKEDERMIKDLNKKAEEESSDKERRYPLTTRTLKRMMSLRLIAESASDAAYDLLRFIQKQINESGGHDRGENDL
nr:ribonuclease H-like domain-containing protein [Tanacetum cinerariifolium]GEZ62818.1 ribonuclease H-like domain-containing protein [Tanacetum cinerariifolium]